MKHVPFVLLLVRLLPAFGSRLQVDESPMAKVVGLITTLRATIESEGMKQQKSYDKFACWCENTLARKAESITKAKETIEESQQTILKVSGELGSYGADLKQLEKDVAENKQAQVEATEVRDKENSAFEAEKTENEQCLGALEAAITVLSGAGEGGKKSGFLETMRDAQLLTVAAGISKVLDRESAARYADDHDIDAVRRFVAHPQDFAALTKRGGFAGVQTGNNPHGDYAPQSTQITGILKGMYDAFAADIEKDNVDEASKQKSYEELMDLKKSELTTLEATLEKQKSSEADKTKLLAETKQLRDDTKAQLKADEVFFQDTKEGCQQKALEWSEVSRARTEELIGIDKATEILTSPEAQAVFTNATTTFLQVSSAQRRSSSVTAYKKLRALAASRGSTQLGRVAAAVHSGGHFDAVIKMVDKMVAVLREEEQDDIEHRDRCQRDKAKNKDDLEDLRNLKTKTKEEIERMGGVMKKAMEQIVDLQKDIGESNDELREMTEMRKEEQDNFKQALKDDGAAVQIINKAITALGVFYKKNKALLQQPQDAREYTVDKDKAPETTFGPSYGGKKTETKGITEILSMLVEDLEKEMETARMEDKASQEQFEKDREAARKVLRSQKETLVNTESGLAEMKEKTADKQEYLAQTEADIGTQKELTNTLKQDCAWVDTHFDARRKKRKAEMDGLNEAKAILAGVEKGDYDELELSTQ
jgi:hypothetical protein